jgi:hypothetical protein
MFGSTAMHLMRECPCPVWIMKPGQSQPFGTSPRYIEKWESEAQKLHKAYIDDFLKKIALYSVKYQVHLLKGKASDLIPQLGETGELTS